VSKGLGVVLAAVIGGSVALAMSYLPSAGSERSGQLVFIPGDPSTPAADFGEARLAVSTCVATDSGTTVEGRLDAPPGSVFVLVSGGSSTDAGTRVGRSDPQDRFADDSLQGLFRITLDWADTGSRFAAAGWQVELPPEGHQGPVVSCP
jgi:hypothetical protein